MKKVILTAVAATAIAVPAAAGAHVASGEPVAHAAESFYNMPTLEADFKRLLNKRLAKLSDGRVHVTLMRCILESRTDAECYVGLSDGEHSDYAVAIGLDGQSFLVK